MTKIGMKKRLEEINRKLSTLNLFREDHAEMYAKLFEEKDKIKKTLKVRYGESLQEIS